jgi:hypothetical protein
MSLYDEIIAVYPELANDETLWLDKVIVLRDDTDGEGAYIEKWEYSKPIPDGMKVGKN